jgi:KUP system potassium uptake protein
MMLAAAYNAVPADTRPRSQNLVLAALGVVYGDIGTSPLYAVRQSLSEFGGATEAAVYGILSLIAWSLILVVTLKYVLVIMRADNRGEGGILAVMALVLRLGDGPAWRRPAVLLAGMAGVALFYGDAMITPAISVLSAVEGLKIATPVFEPYILPISLVLLIALFVVQSRGTAKVGGAFGPIIVVWFAVLAGLGIAQIVQNPRILLAINPLYGIDLFFVAPWRAFAVLGAVFLVVTGAETLYADMGHFGARPVRLAWLALVLPALLLNYLGQGALVLADPSAVDNPFYKMAPEWGLYPLVVLATMATVIASQAVISGAFSVTRQAVQLGLLPRLEVRHTSAEEMGLFYMPWVNYALLAAVIALVLGFQSSEKLGFAYGVAVSATMAITTALAFVCVRRVTGWGMWFAAPLFALFLAVDLAFLASNLLKFQEGGWFSVVVALLIVAIMATWARGRQIVAAFQARDALTVASFLRNLKTDRARIPGTAVFLTARLDLAPGAMLHTLKHYKALHERVVLLTMQTVDVPRMEDDRRLDIDDLGKGFYAICARFGFMEQPSVPRVLALCRHSGLRFELMETSFFVGRQKLRAAKSSVMPGWRRRLFVVLSNNALNATEFFGIPPNRAIEVGGHVEI